MCLTAVFLWRAVATVVSVALVLAAPRSRVREALAGWVLLVEGELVLAEKPSDGVAAGVVVAGLVGVVLSLASVLGVGVVV